MGLSIKEHASKLQWYTYCILFTKDDGGGKIGFRLYLGRKVDRRLHYLQYRVAGYRWDKMQKMLEAFDCRVSIRCKYSIKIF